MAVVSVEADFQLGVFRVWTTQEAQLPVHKTLALSTREGGRVTFL